MVNVIIPSVLQTVPGENSTVYAYFNDGTIRLYDVKPLIAKGGIFAPLADEDFFRARLTVLNDTVAWDITGDRDESACIDIDPFTVYEAGIPVDDPLVDHAGA